MKIYILNIYKKLGSKANHTIPLRLKAILNALNNNLLPGQDRTETSNYMNLGR